MGPKKSDNINKSHRPSLLSSDDQGFSFENIFFLHLVLFFLLENQQCSGKFASDVDLCCRTGYPVNIPVLIRGRPPTSALVHPPSTTNDEQTQANSKAASRGRIPSISQSGALTNLDNNDAKSSSIIAGQDSFRAPSTNTYRTFHLVRDTDYFRPKLSVDLTANESESIDQIQTLYMKGMKKFSIDVYLDFAVQLGNSIKSFSIISKRFFHCKNNYIHSSIFK